MAAGAETGGEFVKITSVQVEKRGAHQHVRVWIDGKLSGTLVVGAGECWDLLCLLEDGAGLGALTGVGREKTVPDPRLRNSP